MRARACRYGHDTHGLATCTIPSYVLDAPASKPYYIPFRALTNDGAENLLVGGKTMAASFSANSGENSIIQKLVDLRFLISFVKTAK